MNKIYDIKLKLNNSKDYDFIRSNAHLGDNIILLGLGGSYAYGTNIETSDIDVRGIATRSAREILICKDFEQVTDEKTDTVIYSLNKILPLLANCNPNTIEMLGIKAEHFLYINKIGQMLLDNKKIFLSRKAVKSFGGYANQQLRRLDNKAQRELSVEEQNTHILNSLNSAKQYICDKYKLPQDSITLFLDKSDKETPIKVKLNIDCIDLSKLISIQSTLNNVLTDYKKLGKRNTNAIIHNKLGKHMMHLIRLYYMCFDILEKGEINTYREKEHDILMAVRNGLYLDSNNQILPDFFEFKYKLEKRLEYASKNTNLPEKPDKKEIQDLQYEINKEIIKNELIGGI